MKALVVDDDATARYFLKRVLTQNFNYEVLEAEDGVEALELLEQHHFSLMLLDVRMPVMDGIETLEQVRNSPKGASLHVIMTTVLKDESVVRRAVALGVTDYVVKTTDTTAFLARLSRALKNQPEHGDRDWRAAGDASIGSDSVVMVVDGDADFRHFFVNLFQAKYRVREAKTAAQALKACVDTVPAVIFMGRDLGIMSRECLVRKARENSRLAGTKFVAVVPKTEVAEVTASGLFTCVATRSFVPEVFMRQVNHLFESQTHLRQFLEAHPQCRVNLITSTEQVFGMFLAEEVSTCPAAATEPVPRNVASIELNAPAKDLTLTLSLSTAPEASRVITARMIGAEPADVPDEDINSGLMEIANVIGGRLQNALREQGLVLSIGLPTSHDAAAAVAEERPDIMALTFAFEKGDPIFTVSLEARAVA